MLGAEFKKPLKSNLNYISLAVFVVCVALAVWVGPKAVYLASATGIVLSTVALVLAIRRRDTYPHPGYAGSLLIFHLFMGGLGLTLARFFLAELPADNLELPRFTHSFVDPSGSFSVRGPSDWNYKTLSTAQGVGVSIRPVSQRQFMGASEIQLMVRELQNVPKDSEAFLDQVVQSLSTGGKENQKKTLFSIHTEKAETLRGERGVWTILDAKRLWIPLRQVTLYGIKNKRFLCSISAAGLKSHDTLFKVVCLGLFEKTDVRDNSALK